MPDGTSIILKDGTLSISDYAFSGCSGLTSITIPNSVIAIGNGAFEECSGLTNLTIPNSVATIGQWAFKDCSGLSSVEIPNSVTAVGLAAFSGTPWYNNLPDGVVYVGSAAYAYKGTMPDGTSIILKDGTVSITDFAFSGRRGLVSITFPNSVTTIGQEAFGECSGLTTLTIPCSVTSLGDGAFWGCNGLTDVYSYIADLSKVKSGRTLFYVWSGSWIPEDSYDYSGRTLHVLQGTAEAYRADKCWNPYFGQIVDDLMPDLPGDVNSDLEVNIADVNAVIDIILGGIGGTPAADVNGDGEINIADINALIDIILSTT